MGVNREGIYVLVIVKDKVIRQKLMKPRERLGRLRVKVDQRNGGRITRLRDVGRVTLDVGRSGAAACAILRAD